MACVSPPDAARWPAVTFPGGTVIPDWSVITTPDACAALSALFEAFIGPKWRGMDDVEHRVRRTVLRAYAATGRAPVPAKIARPRDLRPYVQGDATIASYQQRPGPIP